MIRKVLTLLVAVVTLTLGGLVPTACAEQEEEVSAQHLVGKWQLISVTPEDMAEPCDYEGTYIFYKEGSMDVLRPCDEEKDWMSWKLQGDVLSMNLGDEQHQWRVLELTANRLVLETRVENPDYALSPSRATAQTVLVRMVFKRLK